MTRSVPVLVLVLLLLVSCVERLEQPGRINSFRYYPLNIEDEYIYGGKIRTLMTVRELNDLYTQALLDSTGELVLWQDIIKGERSLGLDNVFLFESDIPSIHFKPALPCAPWSNLVGDTLLINAIEIRGDSINSHLRVQLKYEIMAIDAVATPIGQIEDCIEMQVVYRTLDETAAKFLDGEYHIWYAPGIGIIKYAAPADSGQLLQASIGSSTYP